MPTMATNNKSARSVATSHVLRGQRLLALRNARGLTQAEVAARGGFDRTRMPRIESGSEKLNSTDLVRRLALAYSVPLGTFVEFIAGDVALERLLELSGPLRDVERETEQAEVVVRDERYPEVAQAIEHLRARGEDPAVLEALKDLTIARHGNYALEDLPQLLADARARARKFDAMFGLPIETMQRPTIEQALPKRARK